MKHTVILPLPHKALSPNNKPRTVGGAKAKAVQAKTYRMQCKAVFCSLRNRLKRPLNLPITIHLEFYLKRRQYDASSYYPKDEDNARGSVKAMQDALQDSGLIATDSHKNVHTGFVRLYSTASEHLGRTEIVVTIEESE